LLHRFDFSFLWDGSFSLGSFMGVDGILAYSPPIVIVLDEEVRLGISSTLMRISGPGSPRKSEYGPKLEAESGYSSPGKSSWRGVFGFEAAVTKVDGESRDWGYVGGWKCAGSVTVELDD